MAHRIDGFLRDLRYAARTLRRDPAFVAGVVGTFALAIGANAAMFGLVNRLMFAAPPGVHDAARVARVRISFTSPDGGGGIATTTSYPTFSALRGITSAFSGVAAAYSDTVTAGRGSEVSRIARLATSGSFFTTLGTTPFAGRFPGPNDDALPTGSSALALGYSYWMRTFAGDRAVIGREIVIDGDPFTIVGIAPRGFNGDRLQGVDVFTPLSSAFRQSEQNWSTNQYRNIVTIIVRLRDGMTIQTAEQAASAIFRSEDGGSTSGRTRTVQLTPIVPGAASSQSPQSRIAMWLTGVSLIVLLIATANVGTLLTLRSAKRRREVAVRVALGAPQRALARQLLMESLMLALAGAGMGLILSRWFSQLIRVTLLPGLAIDGGFVDGRVLGISIAVAVLAGIGAGLAPLTQMRQLNLSVQLRAGGAHGASARLRFQKMLVGVQVALCTLLVVGASLFVHSLERVQSQDLGMSIAKVLYVTLDFRGFITGSERDLVYIDAVERVRGIPGVVNSTVAAGVPFGPHNIPPVKIPGIEGSIGGTENPQIPVMYGATPEYLGIMGVTLVRGRLLRESDRRGSSLVLLVNESMARTAWPGEPTIGKCVQIGFGVFPPVGGVNPADGAPCREVVGVVRDSRARSLRPEGSEDRIMQYYVPFEQLPDSPFGDQSNVMGMLVQVSGDVDRTGGLVARAIHASSAVPVFARVRPYQDLIDPQLRSWRLGATLFSAFSVLALGIAAVGQFGVMSYLVAQRTRELGVRMALGGTRKRVAGLVIGDSLRLAAFGVLAGAGAALMLGPLVASMLFQTSPREPVSIGIAVGVLLLMTVLASAWPAWRAGRVSPMVAFQD